MTKKDYELIARNVSQARKFARFQVDSGNHTEEAGAGASCALDDFSREIADSLECLNPAFNRARFLAACGVQS